MGLDIVATTHFSVHEVVHLPNDTTQYVTVVGILTITLRYRPINYAAYR